MSYLRSILYILFFSVLVPLELVIWGQALDTALGRTYLARRMQLSLFYDLPREIWLTVAILSLGAILRAGLELGRESHRRDILLFCGFPFYMFSIFILLKLPCAAAIGTGLVALTAWAVWFACPAEGRPPFPLLDDRPGRADPLQRLTAGVILAGLLLAGILIFQEGYQLWLALEWTPLLVIVPLCKVKVLLVLTVIMLPELEEVPVIVPVLGTLVSFTVRLPFSVKTALLLGPVMV